MTTSTAVRSRINDTFRIAGGCSPGPKREANFVRRIISCVRAGRTPWGAMQYIREFEYGSGRTDVVTVVDDTALIAFEAKLERWRDALYQAYRNRAFASESYVILPHRIAFKTLRNEWLFNQYGVGLCTVRQGEIRVLISSSREPPVLNWLAERALVTLRGPYGDRAAA